MNPYCPNSSSKPQPATHASLKLYKLKPTYMHKHTRFHNKAHIHTQILVSHSVMSFCWRQWITTISHIYQRIPLCLQRELWVKRISVMFGLRKINWKKSTLQKLMNERIETFYCVKNMLNDPLAWKKNEKKRPSLSKDPGKKILSLRCQKRPLGSAQNSLSLAVSGWSQSAGPSSFWESCCPSYKSNTQLDLIYWSLALQRHLHTQHPSLASVKGIDTPFWGTQITNHPSWLSSLQPSRSLFLSGLAPCEMLAATDYNVRAMARRC